MANNSLLVSLVREADLLKKRFPSGHVNLRRGTLRWRCTLQPSEISQNYRIHLTYASLASPRVVVRDPRLVPDTNGHLPHVYSDGSLCLYEPGEWKHGDSLASTIVPWTCEWLFFYEFWLALGVWLGSGGDHTGPIQLPSPSSRRTSSGRPRRNR